MKRAIIVAGALLALGAAQVGAQNTGVALHYDPYYVLPGEPGAIGVDAGIATLDVNSIGDASDGFVAAKYAVNDRIEAGAMVTLGFLNDSRDSFDEVVIGAKYGVSEQSAATLNITPFNDPEKIGVSVGYMQTMQAGGMDINGHLQVALLDAYVIDGIGIDLLIEPVKSFDEKLCGRLDIMIKTNTDDIVGDWLGIDIRPILDYKAMEGLVLNAGISIGLAGNAKQDDIGVIVSAVKDLSM